jgi:hypothetical protein
MLFLLPKCAPSVCQKTHYSADLVRKFFQKIKTENLVNKNNNLLKIK